MVVTESSVETISVLNTPDVIHIGFDLLDHIAQDLTTSIQQVFSTLLTRILPAGETSKCRAAKASIEDYLLRSACTRDTCLIALGGGVIGDLVGYVASTFMRGVPFVQIPTTLLAMVDSSIGGKTAIDTTYGKNLVGTFWQPLRIYISLSMLQTLPKRELANGMAEVIKTAAISSLDEFVKLENGKERIESALKNLDSDSATMNELCADREFLKSVIGASARFKADVVTRDEREGGLRGLLNYGHSFGHAYEAILYPEWLHGECVSLGLLHETELSCALGHCSPEVIPRLRSCLELYGLPVDITASAKEKLTVEAVMERMRVDKKNKGSQKRIVLLSSIGHPWEQKASDVQDADIEKVLHRYISSQTVSQQSAEENNSNRPLPASLFFVAANTSIYRCLKTLAKQLQSRYTFEVAAQQEHIECVSANSQAAPVKIYFTEIAGSMQSPSDESARWYECVVLEKEEEPFAAQALQLINSILQPRHIQPAAKGKQTCFLSLTLSDYQTTLPNLLSQWVEGADAVEYRVDQLAMTDTAQDTNAWIEEAGKQLAYLRRMTSLPIIYTVRTTPQAGKFDPAQIDTYLHLLQWGHRWGCEYVDLELTTLPHNQLELVMQLNRDVYHNTKIIASFHDPNGDYAWSPACTSMMNSMFSKAKRLFQAYDHAGVIKLVGMATSFWSNVDLEQFRKMVDPKADQEVILINMGPLGKFSRVANAFLSPATHPALPSVAAAGQLSIFDMDCIRNELNMNN
ncbi:3-dehydroquinate synthase-domain-containing protein [Mycotypha africana]|uniref:3-dehydroquinate synthase-domain-containing protein n=1 Tax=Mycotypha africana TaxID=64632 RepID=UPI002300D5B1|nr:3-dehydroquinate synthase-domain-containing protein [Mycotypha africana]KAI8982196.1 3-dehydroquinate synthase-domain-containing protein [Mycotypha africana]